jgi:hypothetical protein
MCKSFSRNGISFQYPESWTLVDEIWDRNISAITLEDDVEGIFMIDIYHSNSGPDLDAYTISHYSYFVDELPFGYKIIESPTALETLEHGITGSILEFVVRTLFRSKIRYVNSVFKIVSPSSVNFISCQYAKDNENETKVLFSEFLGSFSAQ